jgi:hypothetical protein
MASVTVNTGEFPSAEGVEEGYRLGQVVGKWARAARGFLDNADWLVRMVEETDRLRLWEKSCDGFRYPDAETFLREKVLLEFDLTERQAQAVIEAIRAERAGDAQSILSDADKARAQTDPASPEYVAQGTRSDLQPRYNVPKSGGNRKDKALRRLARERPDLLERFERGELSANAAALEAGFRRPSVQITAADPAAAAKRIREKLGDYFADQLRAHL